ncbi:MAG: PHP domain-containing protein, partial [Clostridia bacterium]|nr:PHP domain-containing protein [Clostridia bacterium]
LRAHHEGLIALSACVAGEIPRAILSGNFSRAAELVREYVDIFGRDNFFLEVGLYAENGIIAVKAHGLKGIYPCIYSYHRYSFVFKAVIFYFFKYFFKRIHF